MQKNIIEFIIGFSMYTDLAILLGLEKQIVHTLF